jgi:hypothetical protein
MFCPVDLQYGQQVEAVSQVNGTIYCAAHAVEALQSNPYQRGLARRGGFPAPIPVPVPAPAEG